MVPEWGSQWSFWGRYSLTLDWRERVVLLPFIAYNSRFSDITFTHSDNFIDKRKIAQSDINMNNVILSAFLWRLIFHSGDHNKASADI